jgi:hypothetical protein
MPGMGELDHSAQRVRLSFMARMRNHWEAAPTGLRSRECKPQANPDIACLQKLGITGRP